MSLYGYHRRTTPNLERLAEECTVYNRCFAPACWTTPSHGSIFTGLYPSQHGAYEGKYILNNNVQHLVTVLKMMGYQTMGICSNGLISPESRLCQDFDYFKTFVGEGFFDAWMSQRGDLTDEETEESVCFTEGETTKKSLPSLINFDRAKRNINNASKRAKKNIKYCTENFLNTYIRRGSTISTEKTINIFQDIISKNSDNPLFVFINLMETHDLYRPPLKWRQFSKWHDKQRYGIYDLYKREKGYSNYNLLSMYCNLYDDEVYYLDDVIKRLWQTCKYLSDFDETVFIVTSDHGEHLGEKGFYGHIFSLYNELIWVPLVIKFPKSINKRGVSDSLVSLNDLYATILELVQCPLPYPDTSVSLVNSQERKVALSQHIFPETFRNTLFQKQELFTLKGQYFSPPVSAVIAASGLKIIESRDGGLQVFDLVKDSEEANDLAPAMSAESWASMRNIVEFYKNDTSYREAFEEVSHLKPFHNTTKLP